MSHYSVRSFFVPLCAVIGFFFIPSLASASVTFSLVPTATGTYSEWQPNTGATHYTTVDEDSCNGTTDYVATTTTAKRDSYGIALSSVPDNSVITAIAITPCASRASNGGGSSVLDVFYRYNGANSSDQGAYAPSGTTPSALATTTWSNLSLGKTSTSTLEIGMVYSSGTKGGRLSRIAVQLTYGQPPSATTSAATSITTTSAVLNGSGNPNATTTTAWFRIATSTPGTCNDTFGTRVPLSGSTSLGAGTSSVAYATTTASLTQNTTYYYCAIASNGYGKSYGAVQSFTTAIIVTTISSDITTNQTWTTASGTYVVDAGITINSGITLTVNPGVVVKFNGTGAGITVNGTLNANGTSVSPIYFTSYQDDSINGDTNADGTTTSPSYSDWGVIKVNSGGSGTFNYTTTRYGGHFSNGNLWNNGGLLSIATSTIDYSGFYDIRHTSGTTTVASSTIMHGYYTGIGAESTAAGYLTVTNSYFSSNGYNPWAAVFSPSGGFRFTNHGNYGSGGILISDSVGNFASDQTLDPGLPYIIDGMVYIPSGITLTVNPGAIVKFDPVTNGNVTVTLTVNGTLNALGTASSSVYFTSIKDDTLGGDTNADGAATTPGSGDWGAIKIGSTATGTFNYTTARYGGHSSNFSGNIWNNGGVLSVATSTIDYSGYYGLRHASGTTTIASSTIMHSFYTGIGADFGATGSLTVTTSRFSGNGYNPWAAIFSLSDGFTFTNHGNYGAGGILLQGGASSDIFASDQTLESGLPYILVNPMSVPSGITVTLKSAAIMKFDGTGNPGVGLTVNGRLAATSTGAYFTSYKDDAAGGDTNADGTSTTPTAGDWGAVKVNSGGIADFNFATTTYGGYGGKMIWNNGGALSMANTTIASSSDTGVYHSSGITTILASDIHSNGTGLYVSGGSGASIQSSNIHGNSSYGVHNSELNSNVVHAENNYWGDGVNGPRIPLTQETGTGDWILGTWGDVLYTPWLNVVHYLWAYSDGRFISGVHSKTIKYAATSTAYMSALYGAVDTWNAEGQVVISTSTVGATTDLWVVDASSTSAAFVGSYTPNYFNSSGSLNDTLTFNHYYMDQYGSSTQQNTATHELGHALALFHSFLGNIMNPYVTTQTSLGAQDILDYDYCWVGATPNCQ